jgi:hypothetical protein
MSLFRVISVVLVVLAMSGCAVSSGVDVVPATSSADIEHELNVTVASCLRENGHVVSLDGSGLILGDFYDSPEETRQLHLDYDRCVSALGPLSEYAEER